MNRRLADTILGQQERLTFLKQWTQRPRHLPVTYTYAEHGCIHLLEGVTTDFSKSECGIHGSMVPPVGSHTAVSMGRITATLVNIPEGCALPRLGESMSKLS